MAEERNAAIRLAAARAAESATAPRDEPPTDEEPLVSVMAKGRAYLEQKFREHAAKPKVEYVPPPMTAGMRERIEEEQAAGRRVVEKHAAQQAARPAPPRDPSEGFTTPVYRPGDVVPDPTGGNKKFDANA